MLLLLSAGAIAFPGCSGTTPMPQPGPSSAAFSFTTEEVFYIKPPVDRVILVGTITEGAVRVGESLVVESHGQKIPVVLDGIDTIGRGPVQEARKGQQVGLKLVGIRKDQPSRGDRVTRKQSASGPLTERRRN
jgi:translation elongation factor EF-Tu-like GTPase